jgi:hypothetical protein
LVAADVAGVARSTRRSGQEAGTRGPYWTICQRLIQPRLMVVEGESAKGIFYTGGQGRNFRRRKRSGDALSRFADALSWHIDLADVEAGENLATGESLLPNTQPDPGGNPRVAARCVGIKPEQGNAMLQRIRRRLGPQAR